MTSDSICLAELLYMVACYRRHKQSDKAIKLLQDIINLKSNSGPDVKRVLAICLYNLADIYQDLEIKTVNARELFRQAADLWNEIEPNNPMNILWYFSAMQGLQEETDRLILLGSGQDQTRTHQNIA